MLTGKQRSTLRAMANTMEPIFQVGKGGLTEEFCAGLDAALEARELVKVKVLDNSGWTAREAADALSEAVEADVVSVIGSKFVLYRRSQKKQRIFFYD
ncbi:MAG: ribosome assembly RNA-binding protein YhbY [Clostridia bacterium]|nr:ribosome assembly RNA-binding protein YhbY [Clostridia bacterium]